jgi:purine-cytosine permease-like protein
MPKWKSFVMTLTGLTLSFSFVYLLGVGLATGIAGNESWATAYDTSSGALILAGYDGLGGFGKFCDVIVALGVIANNIPGTYAAALNVQVLGRYG